MQQGAGGGRLIGSTDAPLAPVGVAEAEGLRPWLSLFRPRACVCSPLRRASQTAEILCRSQGIERWREDPDLREVDFGEWEGLTFEQASAADPARAAAWAAWAPDFGFPGGETIAGLTARVRRAAHALAQAGDILLVVTHGGVIRLMLCEFLGLESRAYLSFDIRPAGLTVLDVDNGRGVLAGLNLGAEERILKWPTSS